MNKTISRKLGITLAGVLAFIVLTTRIQAGPAQYSVTVLDGLSGSVSNVSGINASGQVAGNTNYHTVRWTGTNAQDLGTLGGTYSFGYGINDSGQIAGYSFIPGNSALHAVRWTGTNAQDLGTLGGTNSDAEGINSTGQVAGSSQITGNGADHAVRWTGTNAQDLGTLGGTYSFGYGINDSGQVAGRSQITGDSAFHAVRWTGTNAQDLGTLGGDSSGSAINASGQVAGYFYLTGASGSTHAVVWTGTTPTDLGTLGGTKSYALGINASGEIIGDSNTTGDASFDAFLYTGGTMYDLNSLLVPGSGVTSLFVDQSFTGVAAGNSINDLGQIVAFGTIEGQTHPLLLTPTPEPSTWAILVAGAAFLVALRRTKPKTSMLPASDHETS